jgi:thioredoxin-related protein
MDIIKKKLESITRGVYLKYDTLKIFSLDEINSLIRNTKQNKPLIVEEFKLHKYSHRYLLFMRDKQECVVCGAKASFWALQRVGDLTNPHLNLWGFDRNNEIVLRYVKTDQDAFYIDDNENILVKGFNKKTKDASLYFMNIKII